MNAAAATFDNVNFQQNTDPNQPPSVMDTIQSSFLNAVTLAKDATVVVGTYAANVVKDNLITTGVALDVVFNGGAFSQKLLVGAVETIASTVGELGSKAAGGILGYFMK